MSKPSFTLDDIVKAYNDFEKKGKNVDLSNVQPRKHRVICSKNNDTHIPNAGRIMNPTYIVDTGTYQNNQQQIASMRNAGIALSVLRQQMLYGPDLEAANPATRVRYAEKLEILAKSREMSEMARSKANKAQEIAKAKEQEKLVSKAVSVESELVSGDPEPEKL